MDGVNRPTVANACKRGDAIRYMVDRSTDSKDFDLDYEFKADGWPCSD